MLNLLSQTRAVLNRKVPPWLAVNVDRHFFSNLQAVLQSPPASPIASVPKSPHWRRITQVYTVLDQYLDQAGTAAPYTTLIQHVQDVTGTGCSRKLISKWKRERGLR